MTFDDQVTEPGESEVGQALYGQSYSRIKQYVDILASKGIEWGLLGPREIPRLWDRHVLNSAALTQVIPEGVRVVDIGSGAGLPGIPLAVLRPDLEIVLCEPLLRRATFLEETVDELDLGDRVSVVRSRAEDLKDSFDVVTSRAVAPLMKLLGWTSHLFLPHGELVALKGASVHDEIAKARSALLKQKLSTEVRQVRAHAKSEPTTALIVRKA